MESITPYRNQFAVKRWKCSRSRWDIFQDASVLVTVFFNTRDCFILKFVTSCQSWAITNLWLNPETFNRKRLTSGLHLIFMPCNIVKAGLKLTARSFSPGSPRWLFFVLALDIPFFTISSANVSDNLALCLRSSVEQCPLHYGWQWHTYLLSLAACTNVNVGNFPFCIQYVVIPLDDDSN